MRIPIIILAGVLIGQSAWAASDSKLNKSLVFKMDILSGDAEKSMDGSYSYTLEFLASGGGSNLKITGGLSGSFAPGYSVLNGVTTVATLFAGNLFAGVTLFVVPKSPVGAYIEAGALAGFGQLSISPAPTGLAESSTGFLYGMRGGFGFQFPVKKSWGIKLQVDYKLHRALALAGQEGFQLDAISVGGGIIF